LYQTKTEIAERYRASARTIDYWRKTFLPSVKISGRVLFDVEECDAAVRQFKNVPPLARSAHIGIGELSNASPMREAPRGK
jgi:hypothetical protein